MNINIPGLDVEKGLGLYDDDEEIYLVILRSWATNAPASIKRLRNVSDEASLKDYVIAIHGLKGTSASIGAEKVRETAKGLEAMAKANDLAGVLANNEAFLKQTETLIENIQDWLKKNPAE
jgi:HPt (histidine-containing phosphotransfer) domain-containing protein